MNLKVLLFTCNRYLGDVSRYLREGSMRTFQKSIPGIAPVLIPLYTEAIARVIKNKLNAILRKTMKSCKLPLEAPYRRAVIDFLNLYFYRGTPPEKKRAAWKEVFEQLVANYSFDMREASYMCSGYHLPHS